MGPGPRARGAGPLPLPEGPLPRGDARRAGPPRLLPCRQDDARAAVGRVLRAPDVEPLVRVGAAVRGEPGAPGLPPAERPLPPPPVRVGVPPPGRPADPPFGRRYGVPPRHAGAEPGRRALRGALVVLGRLPPLHREPPPDPARGRRGAVPARLHRAPRPGPLRRRRGGGRGVRRVDGPRGRARPPDDDGAGGAAGDPLRAAAALAARHVRGAAGNGPEARRRTRGGGRPRPGPRRGHAPAWEPPVPEDGAPGRALRRARLHLVARPGPALRARGAPSPRPPGGAPARGLLGDVALRTGGGALPLLDLPGAPRPRGGRRGLDAAALARSRLGRGRPLRVPPRRRDPRALLAARPRGAPVAPGLPLPGEARPPVRPRRHRLGRRGLRPAAARAPRRGRRLRRRPRPRGRGGRRDGRLAPRPAAPLRRPRGGGPPRGPRASRRSRAPRRRPRRPPRPPRRDAKRAPCGMHASPPRTRRRPDGARGSAPPLGARRPGRRPPALRDADPRAERSGRARLPPRRVARPAGGPVLARVAADADVLGAEAHPRERFRPDGALLVAPCDPGDPRGGPEGACAAARHPRAEGRHRHRPAARARAGRRRGADAPRGPLLAPRRRRLGVPRPPRLRRAARRLGPGRSGVARRRPLPRPECGRGGDPPRRGASDGPDGNRRRPRVLLEPRTDQRGRPLRRAWPVRPRPHRDLGRALVRAGRGDGDGGPARRPLPHGRRRPAGAPRRLARLRRPVRPARRRGLRSDGARHPGTRARGTSPPVPPADGRPSGRYSPCRDSGGGLPWPSATRRRERRGWRGATS